LTDAQRCLSPGAQTGSLNESPETLDHEVWVDKEASSIEQILLQKERYNCYARFVKTFRRTIGLLSC